MKIAPYYQKLLDVGTKATNSLEPITFCGMFDSGVDYLFTLSIPLFEAELSSDIQPIAVDLSGSNTDAEIIRELNFALSKHTDEKRPAADFFELGRYLENFVESKKLAFVLYLGQDGNLNQELLRFLNRMRNLLGWRFSYILYLTPRYIFNKNYEQTLINKVMQRNVVPVLPLKTNDASIVLANYEERYRQKLENTARKKVLEDAGGNPGLIKSIYLQVIKDKSWKKPDLLEESLLFRLKGIADDIPNESLYFFLEQKPQLQDTKIKYQCLRYGYLLKKGNQIRCFSPLISEYLKKYDRKIPEIKSQNEPTVDEVTLHLTQSQRKLLQYLKKHAGQLVNKDMIAQVLWADNWSEKYSDWAIDQFIFGLRKKLTLLKLSGKIVTKKGEGIIFIPKSSK